MNKFVMLSLAAGPWMATALANESHHALGDHISEEIIVTSTALQKKQADTALPVHVLSGDELRSKVATTLGETLEQEVGVHNASFGAGVGQPVIRGHSANRVQVLQGNLGNMDASAVSPDHANSSEPLIAKQVEVIRGPATLLYGNGAIGGVVNVLDNRIPESFDEQDQTALELRHNTVNSGNTAVFVHDGGSGQFAWHVDGSYSDSGEVEIPGFAASPGTLEHEEENTFGHIPNSQQRKHSTAVGGSWIGSKGFVGLSLTQSESDYGLPPGGHHHVEEALAPVVEEEHEEVVRIDVQQQRINLKGEYHFDGFWEKLRGEFSHVDYQHREVEGEELGTRYSNKGLEGRLTLNHAPRNNWSGVMGTQATDRRFAAEGEESFIPRSDIQSLGLFAVESLEHGDWTYELGLRHEQQRISPEQCARQHRSTSASASALWHFSDTSNTSLSLSSSQRSPTVEELFSNVSLASCSVASEPALWVPHLATARIELGNPLLKKEQSNNVEWNLRKHVGLWRGELNLYHNQIRDYIYLADSELEIDGFVVARYQQADATFRGVEASLSRSVELGPSTHLDLRLFGDQVRATLDEGGNLPRIPPRRAGIEVSVAGDSWSSRLTTSWINSQKDTARNETASAAYTLVNLYADYHLNRGDQEFKLFIKGNNLLNEEIRLHTSPVKDLAPQPGRGVELGLRMIF